MKSARHSVCVKFRFRLFFLCLLSCLCARVCSWKSTKHLLSSFAEISHWRKVFPLEIYLIAWNRIRTSFFLLSLLAHVKFVRSLFLAVLDEIRCLIWNAHETQKSVRFMKHNLKWICKLEASNETFKVFSHLLFSSALVWMFDFRKWSKMLNKRKRWRDRDSLECYKWEFYNGNYRWMLNVICCQSTHGYRRNSV